MIVGGGPAGIAAACRASQSGRVGLVDENTTLGGQIWRGGTGGSITRQAKSWCERARRADIELILGTQIVGQWDAGSLLGETDGRPRRLRYDKLILTTGARERFLPFPGWTLPNVMGAGGLQSLVKSGFPVRGKRVAVAGSGPMLLAVAAYLRRSGADVRLIAEQAPWGRLLRFGLVLAKNPGNFFQGLRYKLDLLGVRYVPNCWPVAADGEEALSSVTFRSGRKTWNQPCDYLACGFGLVANLELPTHLGCRIDGGRVEVDQWQQTSVAGVYCAGESTGVGGVDLALIEGQIAGYAAVDNVSEAAKLVRAREKARRFAGALDRAFALREELKDLATPETIVCRCEDVSRRQIEPYQSWKAAKLQTRCGMGACQGRVCGPATEFLFGFGHESVRPPISPTCLGTLAEGNTLAKQAEQ